MDLSPEEVEKRTEEFINQFSLEQLDGVVRPTLSKHIRVLKRRKTAKERWKKRKIICPE